jgi:hypothetical protein
VECVSPSWGYHTGVAVAVACSGGALCHGRGGDLGRTGTVHDGGCCLRPGAVVTGKLGAWWNP